MFHRRPRPGAGRNTGGIGDKGESSMMLKFVPVALAPMLLLAAPAEASSVRFHYSASELSAPSSVDLLYARLNRAAEVSCNTNSGRGIWLKRTQARCVEALLTNFVEKIGDSGLLAAHQANGSRLAIRD
jgi:UrcA family protein